VVPTQSRTTELGTMMYTNLMHSLLRSLHMGPNMELSRQAGLWRVGVLDVRMCS
jgi:hypothetical protein